MRITPKIYEWLKSTCTIKKLILGLHVQLNNINIQGAFLHVRERNVLPPSHTHTQTLSAFSLDIQVLRSDFTTVPPYSKLVAAIKTLNKLHLSHQLIIKNQTTSIILKHLLISSIQEGNIFKANKNLNISMIYIYTFMKI